MHIFPWDLDPLIADLEGRASSIREIRTRMDAAFGSADWSDPNRDRFASGPQTELDRNLEFVVQSLATAAAKVRQLKTDFEAELAWLYSVEQQVRDWLDRARSFLADVVDGVKHLIEGAFDACAHLLGFPESDLPERGSPQWRSVYEQACRNPHWGQ